MKGGGLTIVTHMEGLKCQTPCNIQFNYAIYIRGHRHFNINRHWQIS